MAVVRAEVLSLGHYYVAVLNGDVVSFEVDGESVGSGKWDRRFRKIRKPPTEITSAAIGILSQSLRVSSLGLAVEPAARRERDAKRDLRDAFASSANDELRRNSKRFAHVRSRQFYTVFVQKDDSALIFRNWLPIGKALWDGAKLHSYVGAHLPTKVWVCLSHKLTEWPESEES